MFTRNLLIALVALILFSTSCFAGTPAAPGAKDRCPVCGMFVAPYQNWVSVIQFKGGSNTYFDGPKDMFTFFFNPKKYQAGVKSENISGVFVTEYYSTQLLKAEDVFFVTESDVMGPMGKELVPISGKEAALTFLRDHKGKKILQFDGKALLEIPTNQ